MKTKLALTLGLLLTCFFAEAQGEEPAQQETEKKKQPAIIKMFDGKNLKPWRVLEKDIFEKHGEVSIKNGEIHLAKGNPTTGIVYTKEFPKTNYEISLEAKRVTGGDFFCGLTMPAKGSHCTLIIGGWGGGVTGISNIDNFAAVENDTTGYQEFKNNKWYKIKVRMTDEQIQVWVDKDQIIDFEIGESKFNVWWEQEHARPLGIVNWHTGSALRNIQLKKLAP